MGARIVVVACALTGCAQLAGIDKTSAPPPPDDLTLQFERMSVGATIVTAPLDISMLADATYLVADSTDPTLIGRVDAPATAIDTWTAPIPDGTPPVLFTLPDLPAPLPRIFAIPSRHVLGLFSVLEHPDPQPAPDAATITLAVTLDAAAAATDAFQVFTLGSWTQRVLSALEVPAASASLAVTYPFASSSSVTGRPLEKLTIADAELVLRYVGPQLTGAFEAPPFDQTGTDTITGTLAAVAADQTLDVTVDQATATTRFATLVPAMSAPAFNWSVVAAPGYAIGSTTGVLLQAGGLLATDPGAITAAFGNPFLAAHDWRSVFTWSTSATRTFTPAGGTAVATLSAGMFQLVEPAPALVLALPAGLPQVIMFANTALSTDGTTVTIDPLRAAALSFTSDQPPGTLYQLQLFELVPSADGLTLVQTIRFAATGTAPSFALVPELFTVGHTYSVRAICVAGGYPAIADGDLQQRALPLAVSFFDSAVFTVAAP
jgi:hypothetical protein